MSDDFGLKGSPVRFLGPGERLANSRNSNEQREEEEEEYEEEESGKGGERGTRERNPLLFPIQRVLLSGSARAA